MIFPLSLKYSENHITVEYEDYIKAIAVSLWTIRTLQLNI